VALDHGRSRIGLALPKALSDIQGENIIEIVKKEAIKSMASFNLNLSPWIGRPVTPLVSVLRKQSNTKIAYYSQVTLGILIHQDQRRE
jgi:hypothetical protein